MHPLVRRIFILLPAVAASSFLYGTSAHAALQGNVRIEQVSPSAVGVWTLYTESGTTRTSKDPGVDPKSYSFGISEVGQITLSVTPPPGMSVKVSMYRGGELQWAKDSQQESFKLYPNDNYRFVLQYSLTKLGTLGITSEPSSLTFRIKGPTTRRYSGRTPKTLINLPAGRYTVYLSGGEKCAIPAPQTAVVEPGERNTIHITVNCNVVTDETPERIRRSKRDLVDEAYRREVLRSVQKN